MFNPSHEILIFTYEKFRNAQSDKSDYKTVSQYEDILNDDPCDPEEWNEKKC